MWLSECLDVAGAEPSDDDDDDVDDDDVDDDDDDGDAKLELAADEEGMRSCL